MNYVETISQLEKQLQEIGGGPRKPHLRFS